jgi:prolyl-tRNA editing enzyme YbaK/EbsC (Cys-tRNA(Pro) deacylase)
MMFFSLLLKYIYILYDCRECLPVHTARWRRHVAAHTCVAAVERWTAQQATERRIAALEAAMAALPSPGKPAATAAAPRSLGGAERATDPPTTEVHARLHKFCEDAGLQTWRFRRVSGEYYSWSLEQRRAALGAASVDHLTKSLILRNTAGDDSDPYLHVLVLTQYTAKLDTVTLNKFIKARRKREDGQSRAYNYTLAPEEVGFQLSGYGHNAVTPLNMAVRIPIIMSHAIRSLEPGFFWMGGGEVDLKLGMTAEEAERHFDAIVAAV